MALPHTAEGDAFAIAMIVVMVSAFCVIGLILFTIFRSAAKRNRDVEDLIDEVKQEEEKEKNPTPKGQTAQAWEKNADWWKKD